MYRVTILILTLVPLLLVERIESSRPAGNRTEISSNTTRRILHGTRARDRDFPFLVKFKYLVSKSLCGGSIISNNWILTAAHCLRQESCSGLEIFPAAWLWPLSVPASRCYLHEHSSARRYEYDIGLVRVARDLLREGKARAIPLPPPGKVYPAGTSITIVGWGSTETNKYPINLMQATVHIETWEKCNKKYLAVEAPKTIDMPIRTVCTQGSGPKPSGMGAGDSGGPAIAPDGNVIGVASFFVFGSKPDHEGSLSVYVSVVDYLPWIYKLIDPGKITSNFPVSPEHPPSWSKSE